MTVEGTLRYSTGARGEMERVRRGKRIKVYYLSMCRESIKKPTKYFL
jgi:hypothetical protein